jgi:hypothetical protein
MMKNDGLRVFWTPVFVENLDVIFGCDERHDNPHSLNVLEQDARAEKLSAQASTFLQEGQTR